MADRPGDFPELVEAFKADILNLARLQGKSEGVGEELAIGMQALRDADVGAETLAAITRGLAKTDVPELMNLLKAKHQFQEAA